MTTTLRRLASWAHGPLVAALGLGLAALIQTVVWAGGQATSDFSTAAVLNLLATVSLAACRRHLPATTAVVTTATFLTQASTTPLTAAAIISQLAVLYLAGARYPRRILALLGLPFLLTALSPADGDGGALPGVLLLVLAVAALALGDARRLRGQAIADRDAARQAMAASLREQAVMHERARIARELHDVVAHHISMIAVQADTVRLTTPGISEESRQRLAAMGDTARDTLTELRRLLGVLRQDAGGTAEHTPQPGLSRLDELAAGARAAGTPVRLHLTGQVVPLPPSVDVNAYRIVQEALTNARRHAPGAQVDVEVCYTTNTLHIRVRDNGPGPASDGRDTGGHGLLGMRERAAMVGGTLRAGPGAAGGFTVEADLPVQPAPSGTGATR